MINFSKDVCNEIDILDGADLEFIDVVNRLEQEKDGYARAAIAAVYIEDHKYLKEVSYPDLGKYLANPSAYPIQLWRELYLLERSIPPRFGSRYTWLNRLRIFYDTFLFESQVVGTYYKNHKLYFRTGNKDNPTNHDKLVMGAGKSGSDFYYFDGTLPGDKNYQKMVSVEFKYCKEGSAQAGAEKYLRNNKFTYGAKLIVLYVPEDKAYYMVDYTTQPYTITKLNIKVPTGLIEVK